MNINRIAIVVVTILVFAFSITLLILGYGERYGIAAIFCIVLGIYYFLTGYLKWKGIHGVGSRFIVEIYGEERTWKIFKQLGVFLIILGFLLIII